MAKAQIRVDENGGIEVFIPAWDELVVLKVEHGEMKGIMDECTEDGQAEPNYEELALMICDLVREQLDVQYTAEADLRKAVQRAVTPGPAFQNNWQFSV